MLFGQITSSALWQVVPALVARLPLKEDLEENKTVFSCLAMLYTHSPDLVQYTERYTGRDVQPAGRKCWQSSIFY